MENKDLTLGQKLKNLRKRAGLSQLELETTISAAPGSISRIEADKVNPTKETLLKISSALDLTTKEESDILGITSLHPSEAEVSSALLEVEKPFHSPGLWAYLIDDWWVIHDFSDDMLNLLGISREESQHAIGVNLLEVLLDPKFGIRKVLDQEHFIQNYALEFARARAELNEDIYGSYLQELVEKIKDLPDFDEIWETSEQAQDDLVLAGLRISYVKMGDQRFTLNHARERLKTVPRFEVIELFNPQPYE